LTGVKSAPADAAEDALAARAPSGRRLERRARVPEDIDGAVRVAGVAAFVGRSRIYVAVAVDVAQAGAGGPGRLRRRPVGRGVGAGLLAVVDGIRLVGRAAVRGEDVGYAVAVNISGVEFGGVALERGGPPGRVAELAAVVVEDHIVVVGDGRVPVATVVAPGEEVEVAVVVDVGEGQAAVGALNRFPRPARLRL